MSAEQQPRAPLNGERQIVQLKSIPAEIQQYPQWVCWRYGEQTGDRKPAKQPINPWSLHLAGVHWPSTWSTFAHAYTTYLMYRSRGICGIGFVLTAQDPVVAIDLDHCVHDGEIAPHAWGIVAQIESYTELSPSGAGLRLLVNCPDFFHNARRTRVEIYAQSRFVTITGHHLSQTPTTITAVAANLLTGLVPRGEIRAGLPSPHLGPDIAQGSGLDLWEHIFAYDRCGDQHRRRFLGDMSLDGGDHSLTVIRLLNCLARWTQGDPAWMRALMLLSPLANEKWLSRRGAGDWLDYQIADALHFTSRGP